MALNRSRLMQDKGLHETPRRTALHDSGVRTRFLAIVLATVLVLAACGGDDDANVGGGPGAGELTLVSSGAYWRGAAEPQTTFDVSEMKTDPKNLGVVVRWEFATHESNPTVRPDITASYAIDGFSPDGNSASIGSARTPIDDRGGLTLDEVDGGFVIEWRLGFLLGASDLTDPEEFEEFMAETGVNLADSDYQVEFAEDADGDGILVYGITLSGEFDVDGQAVSVSERVEFEGFESDPTVAWIERDEDARDAVERAESIEDAEDSGCSVIGIDVALPTATLTTSDGLGTITVDVPEGWDAEIPDYGGPCPSNVISFDVPDDDGRLRLGPSVLIVEPYADTLLDHLAEDAVQQNIRLDDNDDEITLQPGDEFYAEYAEPEPFDVGGLEAYLVRSATDYGGGSQVETLALWVDLGTEYAFLFASDGPFFDETDFMAFLDGVDFAAS